VDLVIIYGVYTIKPEAKILMITDKVQEFSKYFYPITDGKPLAVLIENFEFQHTLLFTKKD